MNLDRLTHYEKVEAEAESKLGERGQDRGERMEDWTILLPLSFFLWLM